MTDPILPAESNNRKAYLLRAQIVQAALAAGMICFGAIVGFLYFKNPPIPREPLAQAVEQLRFLSIFNLVFFITTWSVAPFVRRRILAGKGSYLHRSVDFDNDSLDEAFCKRWFHGRHHKGRAQTHQQSAVR